MLVGGRPDDVVVGEVNRRTLVKSLGAGSYASVLRHQQIEDDLLVTGPVSAISENEDSVDDDLVEVQFATAVEFLLRQLPERSYVLLRLDDITGGHHISEAVFLGDDAAFFTLAADYEDGLVCLGHLAHWCMSADELAGRDLDLQLATEIEAAFFFCLTATVCDEDIRSDMVSVCISEDKLKRLHLHSIRILPINISHRIQRRRKRLATLDKDAIDIESDRKFVCDV